MNYYYVCVPSGRGRLEPASLDGETSRFDTLPEAIKAADDLADDLAEARKSEGPSTIRVVEADEDGDLPPTAPEWADAYRRAVGGWFMRADGETWMEAGETAADAADAAFACVESEHGSVLYDYEIARAIDEDGDMIDSENEIRLAHPDEPPCGRLRHDPHEWSSDHELVGGMESNPGVWGAGGCSVRTVQVCARCGVKCSETSPSQGAETEHDHTVIYYEEPGDDERDALVEWWVARDETPDESAPIYDDVCAAREPADDTSEVAS